MGLFSRSSSEKLETPWEDLISVEQLEQALNEVDTAVFLFKHSTRCSISTMAKSRFEREWQTPIGAFHLFYLDLLSYRSISNRIEELTHVQHQSPQLIVVKNGVVTYTDTHSSIAALEAVKSITH